MFVSLPFWFWIFPQSVYACFLFNNIFHCQQKRRASFAEMSVYFIVFLRILNIFGVQLTHIHTHTGVCVRVQNWILSKTGSKSPERMRYNCLNVCVRTHTHMYTITVHFTLLRSRDFPFQTVLLLWCLFFYVIPLLLQVLSLLMCVHCMQSFNFATFLLPLSLSVIFRLISFFWFSTATFW